MVAYDQFGHDGRSPGGDPLDFLDEILGLVVDGVSRADFPGAGAFLVGAGGDDDGEAGDLAQQDGGGADAAGTRVDDKRVARQRPARQKEVAPDREEVFGERTPTPQVD